MLYNIIYNVFNNDEVFNEKECIVVSEFIQVEKKPFIVNENSLIIYMITERSIEMFEKSIITLDDQIKML